LDADSEGLLLLSDEAGLNARLLNPRHGHQRTYWVQVEGIPSEKDLVKLRNGLPIRGHFTLPCRAKFLKTQAPLAERIPPVRFRKSIPTCWLEISLDEGKNRQVRRMTAAIGYPTLRLMRVGIGGCRLSGLEPGQWRVLSPADRSRVFTRRRGGASR
jgi:23S rRNA pseudouridine2457 synthase